METPTTRQLSDQIVGQLQASLSQTIPLLPKAFARVLAWVLAGAIVIVYKYAGFIFLQLFVAHASAEETTINGKKVTPLIEWGVLLGVGRPHAATRAEQLVSVKVTNQSGELKAGQTLLRTETRVLYQIVATVALDAPIIQFRIKAIGDDAGGDGSGSIGNVATTATVVSQVVTGADAEPIETYRARIVRRVQRRPQGGAYADYQSWGEEVLGIAHVYPYAGVIPGTVELYVEATEESSGSPDGIPTAPQIAAVLDAITLNESGKATRRPVNAAPLIAGIVRLPFDVQISGLAPDNADNRTAIEDGVDEYLRTREPFIVGLSVLPREDRVTAAAVSGVVDSIVNALGATVTTVTLTPGPAYTLGHGEKAKLGTPSYV
jgi:uncharacterized phage protein gp47/JayE